MQTVSLREKHIQSPLFFLFLAPGPTTKETPPPFFSSSDHNALSRQRQILLLFFISSPPAGSYRLSVSPPLPFRGNFLLLMSNFSFSRKGNSQASFLFPCLCIFFPSRCLIRPFFIHVNECLPSPPLSPGPRRKNTRGLR